MILSARLTKCEIHIPLRLFTGGYHRCYHRVMVEFTSTSTCQLYSCEFHPGCGQVYSIQLYSLTYRKSWVIFASQWLLSSSSLLHDGGFKWMQTAKAATNQKVCYKKHMLWRKHVNLKWSTAGFDMRNSPHQAQNNILTLGDISALCWSSGWQFGENSEIKINTTKGEDGWEVTDHNSWSSPGTLGFSTNNTVQKDIIELAVYP